ncbi:CIS tube protein [Hyalangium versicolor]|uniref:CIS tube protein n=1 Tax=Hyalangium versicolor TaxID=2861190 RepID=UPI001CC9B3BB|nr:hypothetical protein [Hyalangium versicolor]
MSGLVKATLQRIWSTETDTETEGDPVEVQFNPASLRLALSNTVEGGQSKGRQARQFIGSSSTNLSFDLVFDTADEGTPDGRPRSVREKTALVEQFVVPEVKGNDKQAPPKVRFQWNDLIIDGIISSLTIDLDFFASDGTPLRAKMGVSIQEQDAKYQFLQRGAGANRDNHPTDKSALALAGESLADFATRMGLDPAAWRGLSASVEGTLSLEAGVEIDFNSNLSASAGLGASIGVEAGVSASLEASFGLEGNASTRDTTSSGLALAASGGVGAAIETVQSLKADTAADAARKSFGVPSASTASSTTATRTPSALTTTSPVARPSMPEQSRTPLSLSGVPSLTQQAQAPSRPAPPQADPRATSFGLGVPLRPRVTGAVDQRAGAVSGHVPLRPAQASNQVPETRDPAAPPWTQLPAGDKVRAAAQARQAQRSPSRKCGCRGACSHGGGPSWR